MKKTINTQNLPPSNKETSHNETFPHIQYKSENEGNNQEKPSSMGNTSCGIKVFYIAPLRTSHNGIGHYTGRLIDELRSQDSQVKIVSSEDLFPKNLKKRPEEEENRDFPSQWPSILLEAIDKNRPDLVHIQHGFYLGHGHKLAYFIRELHIRGIRCVITLHGIWAPNLFRRWPASLYRLLAEDVEHVIVHQREESFKYLQEYGVPANRIAVIPHGTWTHEEITLSNIRDKIPIKNKRIVLFVGNIFRRKGLHVLLKAFPEVIRQVPDACLLVVGNERINNPIDRFYNSWLHSRMREGLKEGWLIRGAQYIPDEELWGWITSADVVIFPYLRKFGAASGIFHRVLAAGLPAICSNIPTFAEAIRAWGEKMPFLFPKPGDWKALGNSIINILSNEHFRKQAMEASKKLGCETSWPVVAKEHLLLYRSLLSTTPIKDEK